MDCSSLAAQDLTVGVTATDSAGMEALGHPLSYTVLSDPSLGALRPSPATADVGQTVIFQTSASADTGGFSYSSTSHTYRLHVQRHRHPCRAFRRLQEAQQNPRHRPILHESRSANQDIRAPFSVDVNMVVVNVTVTDPFRPDCYRPRADQLSGL